MRHYHTENGERLVVQGSQPQTLDQIQEAARRDGRCSVCNTPTNPDSLDRSARCIECQP